MKSLVLAGLICLGLVGCAAPRAPEPSRIIFVRHAEKTGDTGDVPLSEAGEKRARDLVRILGDAKIEKIYTTDLQRTVNTARPLAERLNLQPEVLPIGETEELARRLRSTPPGATVLVVSHSGRIPVVAEKLGVKAPPIDESEYDRMTIVLLAGDRASELTLRYGD
ncbi:MAG: histidine phosphatase family protein [Bryobacterales bacterium]|nr:histidine phosphatase family protein [Bryobacterales bacterium]